MKSQTINTFTRELESAIVAGMDRRISRRAATKLGLSGSRAVELNRTGLAVCVQDNGVTRYFFRASDGLRVVELQTLLVSHLAEGFEVRAAVDADLGSEFTAIDPCDEIIRVKGWIAEIETVSREAEAWTF